MTDCWHCTNGQETGEMCEKCRSDNGLNKKQAEFLTDAWNMIVRPSLDNVLDVLDEMDDE